MDKWLKCYEWSILPKFQETLSGQAHEVRLVDKWFKGRLGGVCCMEWLGSRVMGGLFCVNGCWGVGGCEYVWEKKTNKILIERKK